jgi:ABC-type glycerol-3-phosphate transport system permease component
MTRSGSRTLTSAALYLLLSLCSVAFMIPFLFAVGTSLKPVSLLHIYPPILFPPLDDVHPENFVRIFNVPFVPFAAFYRNTIIITVGSLIGAVISATASAYGFARFRWPGRDFFFMVLLATIVLPEEVVIIPKFLMFHLIPDKFLGGTWIDTYWPLILPSWFGGGAFSVFLLRQFFMQIPTELDEAARIDGAGDFRIYWKVILPLSRAAMATAAAFTFFGVWTDFFGPLIYTNSTEMRTLEVGLAIFKNSYGGSNWPLQMTAAVIVMMPLLIVFLFVQRYFTKGIMLGSIK